MNNELLTRAISNVTPKDLAEKKLSSGDPIRIYFGIDPTGAHLHVGHAVPLRKLRALQDAGHHVVLLIGSFTAMIGDPTGKDEMRKRLTAEEVQSNFEDYKQQAALVLDMEKLEIAYNHTWLSKLDFNDVADLASNFTVQQMLERDMFDKRIKSGKPIAVSEFLYPLMVGYDSVALDVDCELGGNDQYFNMLAGRTLQKAFGKRDKFVLTTPLIEGTDGRKMSKTYNNCVYLTDSPTQMFGKIMSMKDHIIPSWMECCTNISLDDIAEVNAILERGDNPKNCKVRLAKEIITMYHSADAADAAEQEFAKVFKDGGVPDVIEEFTANSDMLLIDALVEAGTLKSKSDGRRVLEQGGIKVDDIVIEDQKTLVQTGVVKVGKKRWLKITVA